MSLQLLFRHCSDPGLLDRADGKAHIAEVERARVSDHRVIEIEHPGIIRSRAERGGPIIPMLVGVLADAEFLTDA